MFVHVNILNELNCIPAMISDKLNAHCKKGDFAKLFLDMVPIIEMTELKLISK